VKEEVPPGAVTQFLKRHREFEAAPFRVEAFQLYASTLHSSGAVHTLKREFALQPSP
jgi:2'-5' RNA ligase